MKWRFFRHLTGGDDPEADNLYRWHIAERSGVRMRAGVATDEWKRSVDDYVQAAASLTASMMQQGFLPFYAVPVDPNGELLNGSHRVACALALRIHEIPVQLANRTAWAPPWDRDWFLAKGMDAAEVSRLEADMERIKQ